jgi:hypothetical protein
MKTPTRAPLAAVTVTILLSARAQALSFDFRPIVDAGYAYNTNVFLTHSAADTEARTGQSERGDSIVQTAIGSHLILTHSLQKLDLEGQYGYDHYQQFSQLDGSRYKLKGRADLAIGSTLGATLTGSNNRELQSYAGRADDQRSYQTNTLGAAEFYYWLTPRIAIKPEFDLLRYRYSLASQSDGDLNENARQLSIEYSREAFSAVGLKLRDVDGVYPLRNPVLDGAGLERDYVQRSYTGFINYTPSGLSQFKLEAGYTRRSHDQPTVPNYSGATGRLSYRRTISGKTYAEIQLFRNLQSINEIAINYVQETGVAGDLNYVWSGKTTLDLGYQYFEDRFLGASALDPANEGRVDHVQALKAGIEYAPSYRFLVTPQLRYEDRSSTRQDRTYNYALFAVEARYSY